ncbi:ATP-dependent RNA helicase DHX29-like isoform X2 [Pecten maximus]|uniref:ATP-dependent RNA helicase DHX29-like isoform X2 n=1 Tax=Pecten maximus TaxID=6579 RepID=UPI001458F65A|nr:ATP-dependent RNA helicase DHX29-like isoform X2 [Pecten maximus]
MGKKKQAKQEKIQPADDSAKIKKNREEKGKKTYSLPKSGDKAGQDEKESSEKIKVPRDLEQDIIQLINDEHAQTTRTKELSKRITNKKLMDMYSSLQGAGFSHNQIEQAMSNTVTYGGDLIDSLDWLCLNLANDKLPKGFSETLEKEEIKTRPKFERKKFEDITMSPLPPTASSVVDTSMAPENTKTQPKEAQMKDWILQYTEQSSDEEGDEEEDIEDIHNIDPNERYLELTAKLLDAKEEAAQVKKEGDKVRQRELGQKIRKLLTDMNVLESDPKFDPAVKIKDLDKEKSDGETPTSSAGQPDMLAGGCQGQTGNQTEEKLAEASGTCKGQTKVKDNEDEECTGFALFEEMAAKEEPKKISSVKVAQDVRDFEYTRQQWTGKSPKQFLIDWCRKHKCEAPKYYKVQHRGSKWASRCMVDRKKDGKLEVVPEILCENIKEAEHLASTLALYELCKGQSVHQLLPPPYRAVWLEWLDREKEEAALVKQTENKPRDQFISKLMKKLKISVNVMETDPDEEGDTVVESWEDLDDMESSEFEDSADEKDEKTDIISEPPVNDIRSHPTKSRRRTGTLSGIEMKGLYERRRQSGGFRSLLQTRQELPVYKHRTAILDIITGQSVVVIAGETGSGKSTQIPQFILEHFVSQGQGQKCNIVCTEPRRISATSLSHRVSQEMGEGTLGSHDSLVGYQIRFESKCSPNSHLVYCTTGVLLRRLQTDPTIQDVTHIVVDEVHERSVQSDFLLIILRRLLLVRTDLKIILMSATLDSEKFSAYFHHCSVINIPGRTFPVEVYHVEDVIERTLYVLDDDSPYALRPEQLVKEEQANLAVTGKGGEQTRVDVYWTKENVSKIDRTDLCPDTYSLRTRNTVTRSNTDRINMELIVELLCYLEKSPDFSQVEGAVLIFMPGLADIQELYELLMADRNFTKSQRYQVIALHSILSSSDQNEAFRVPPPGIRKVVIATNIAETGITIPDVVFVIDTGKVKENRYMESSQMSALREVYISKANAKQRQGRAGRVREGFCFRMYTKERYQDMAPYTVPEIQRVPLEELCLHIMKCELGEPEDFLSEALDPPRPNVIARAMGMLHEVGACREGSKLTPLGHHLAALPVHVRIGKVLLIGAIFGYLEPVAVIAAAMTTKSPFVAPIQKLDLAQAAKVSLATAASDHLTVYKAYLGWQQAKREGGHVEQQYCQKYFLRRNTLLEIENLSNDLIRLVKSIGFGESRLSHKKKSTIEPGSVLQISKSTVGTSTDIDLKTVAMVKAAIAAGLYPNVAKVTYNAPVDAAAHPRRNHVCVGETGQGPAGVHPSSVNRTLAANGWIAFQEKVTTSKVYLREVTLVSPFSLLLFGGDIHVQHTDQLVTVDDRISFTTFAKTGVMFRELRNLLDKLLEKKLAKPSLDLLGDKVIVLICELLWSERTSR